jgi:hypothetical protein
VKVHAQQQGGLAVEVGGVEKFLEVAPNGMVEQMTVTSTKIRMGQTKKSQVPLLASPVEFVLLDATTSKPLALNVTTPLAVTKHTAATATWATALSGDGGATVSVNGSFDFDSYGEQTVTVTAGQKSIQLADIQLRFTVAPTVAKYMVGMSHGVGVQTVDTAWKWTNVSGDPMVWIGRIEGGVYLKLRGSGPDWEDPNFSKDYPVIPFIPQSWGGAQAVSGEFGCNISSSGAVVAYSGPRTLKPGQSVVFQYDLAATPSKTLNMTKHFAARYYQISGNGYHSPAEMKAKGVTVATLHQGIPGQVAVDGSPGPSLVNPYVSALTSSGSFVRSWSDCRSLVLARDRSIIHSFRKASISSATTFRRLARSGSKLRSIIRSESSATVSPSYGPCCRCKARCIWTCQTHRGRSPRKDIHTTGMLMVATSGCISTWPRGTLHAGRTI